MKEVNLLSSAAVLRALYDNKKDIYDVIAEFIRASIKQKSIRVFDSMECTELLLSEFGFRIPEAIVKSCLKNRLKKNGEIDLIDGRYCVSSKFSLNEQAEKDFSTSRNNYEKIITELTAYCESRIIVPIDRSRLKSDFEAYLLNPEKAKEYTSIIANFILVNEETPEFRSKINQIEEGLILYTGIRYSPNLSTLGHWSSELTIFIDTEHLFNATGLNGILYKAVFDDFYGLVKEANQKRKGKIHLKYFRETLDEVEKFFYAAEKIVENRNPIDPSKTAMLNIINGCKYPSDVLEKKSKFLEGLNKLSISQENPRDYYANPSLNIESSNILDSLKEDFQSDNFELPDFLSMLKLFTKVNVIRNGQNDLGIDGVSAIFLTENRLTQKIAFSKHVFPGNGAIPFATNIEFMTEKLWFKLNKGFGGDIQKPISFDAVIRARLVLSSQVSSSVANTYRSMLNKYKCKELSDAQLAIMYKELRHIPTNPDDINADNANISAAFLEDDFIEKSLREKSLLEKQSEEGKAAIEELREIRYQQRLESLIPLKKKARLQYRMLYFLTFVVIPVILILLIAYFYKPVDDSKLSIIFGIISTVSLFVSFVIYYKKINLFYWNLSRKCYKLLIKNHDSRITE